MFTNERKSNRIMDANDRHEYEVTYNTGFGDKPLIIETTSFDEARKLAVAEYRRNHGAVNILDFFTPEAIVKEVKQLN